MKWIEYTLTDFYNFQFELILAISFYRKKTKPNCHLMNNHGINTSLILTFKTKELKINSNKNCIKSSQTFFFFHYVKLVFSSVQFQKKKKSFFISLCFNTCIYNPKIKYNQQKMSEKMKTLFQILICRLKITNQTMCTIQMKTI